MIDKISKNSKLKMSKFSYLALIRKLETWEIKVNETY